MRVGPLSSLAYEDSLCFGAGVYPPTDRISALTCMFLVIRVHTSRTHPEMADWWGLEIVLPPPTLVYLSVSPHLSYRSTYPSAQYSLNAECGIRIQYCDQSPHWAFPDEQRRS